MKKAFSLLLVLVMAFSLAACGAKPVGPVDEPAPPSTAPDPVELIVFGAASMTETLTRIGEQYMADHTWVTIRFNFDSSGALKTQIEQGADCDIFLSAGQKQMDQLEELAMIDTATRFDILENKVALCVATNSDCGITSYDNLAEALKAGTIKLAMGNSDVPVGQYTQKIFAHYGLDEAALTNAGCISYGSNVKEVTTQVSEGTVDCGIIYATDAFSAGLDVSDTATAAMCGQVIYPAAILKEAPQPTAAAAFVEYLKTAEASSVFESVGFTPLAD